METQKKTVVYQRNKRSILVTFYLSKKKRKSDILVFVDVNSKLVDFVTFFYAEIMNSTLGLRLTDLVTILTFTLWINLNYHMFWDVFVYVFGCILLIEEPHQIS